MRVLPVELADLLAIVIPGVIPAVPLAALVMPLADIVKDLARLLV